MDSQGNSLVSAASAFAVHSTVLYSAFCIVPLRLAAVSAELLNLKPMSRCQCFPRLSISSSSPPTASTSRFSLRSFRC